MEVDLPIKKAPPRKTSRRSPLLKGRVRGQWYPDLVGKIRGYPKTQEIHDRRVDLMRTQIKLYNAEGITGRAGVPDGWAGKKKLIKQINAQASEEAGNIVEDLVVTGRFTPDNAEAQVALRAALTMIVAEKHTPESAPVPLYSPADRLKAMKLVLDTVQRKPVSTSVVAEGRAEDFLKDLARAS